jgi:hypothetical protein
MASTWEKVHFWQDLSRGYAIYKISHCRIWLTRLSAGGFVIENKTISRKHLTIEVANVKPGDSVSIIP